MNLAEHWRNLQGDTSPLVVSFGCENRQKRTSEAHSHRAPGKIRTCDTRFRRAVLYPLSYEGGRVSQSPAVHRRAIVPRRRLG